MGGITTRVERLASIIGVAETAKAKSSRHYIEWHSQDWMPKADRYGGRRVAGFSSWFEVNLKNQRLIREYEAHCEVMEQIGEEKPDFKTWMRSYYEEHRDAI